MVKENRSSVTANLLLAQVDVDAFLVDRDPRLADRRQKPPPVGIGSGPRCFHQWRSGNGGGNLSCFSAIASLFDSEPHHVLHALTVGDDLRRQRAAYLGDRRLKLI